MTYTYCEAAMWHIMMPAAFRYLSETEPDWNIPALKRRSKQVYRQIVSRTPDIGSMMNNPLRVCMTGGMLWLSVFEAAEGRMSEEHFEGMVNASMKTPLVQKSYRSKAKIAFTLKAQKKRMAFAARTDAASNPYQCAVVWLGIEPMVGIIILLGGILVVVAPPLFHKLLKMSAEDEWAENDEFYSTCLDGLQGIVTLKAFNVNTFHRKKVEEQSEKHRKAIMSNLILTTLNSRMMELLISAGEITVNVVGVWATVNGSIETYHMVMLFMLMRAWADGARNIMGAWLRANKGVAAFESGWEILDGECAYSLTHTGTEIHEAESSAQLNGDVEFAHVTFAYADVEHPTIRNLSVPWEHMGQSKAGPVAGIRAGY